MKNAWEGSALANTGSQDACMIDLTGCTAIILANRSVSTEKFDQARERSCDVASKWAKAGDVVSPGEGNQVLFRPGGRQPDLEFQLDSTGTAKGLHLAWKPRFV